MPFPSAYQTGLKAWGKEGGIISGRKVRGKEQREQKE